MENNYTYISTHIYLFIIQHDIIIIVNDFICVIQKIYIYYILVMHTRLIKKKILIAQKC